MQQKVGWLLSLSPTLWIFVDNVHMANEGDRDKKSAKGAVPEKALRRTARMASLPMGYAGRTALGLGKRIGGKSADAVNAQIQAQTAAQMYRVMGDLKGGAMKLGQAMSVFEAALPEEMAEPYRQTLTRLQDSAPSMSTEMVHQVLTEELGPDWRERFQQFNDAPSAAASIGQVHKAIYRDGRPVAVKLQYPGAAKALMSDLNQLSRMGRVMGGFVPGLDIKPLLEELKARVSEELDYLLESDSQRRFAVAFDDDPDFEVPHVLAATPRMLISEWVDGTPLSKIIEHGDQTERDHAATLYQRFLLSGPGRAGLMHADPHPGNFRITADGKLAVLDFGAVAHLPGGLPPAVGMILKIALDKGDAESVVEGLRAEGFIKPNIDVDPDEMLSYLLPFIEPLQVDVFHYSREWLRGQFARIRDPRNRDFNVGLKLNLPPSYMLIHRVWMGSIGVLCQLDAYVASRQELVRWVPGFDES